MTAADNDPSDLEMVEAGRAEQKPDVYAGTVVMISVPVCPCCGLRADEQDSANTGCTFDWKAWAQGWCS